MQIWGGEKSFSFSSSFCFPQSSPIAYATPALDVGSTRYYVGKNIFLNYIFASDYFLREKLEEA